MNPESNSPGASRALPAGFAQSMRDILPADEAQRLIDTLTGTPPVTAVRLNAAKPCDPNLPVAGRVAWCPEGRRLSDRPAFTFIPQLHAGGFYVQEPASMIHSLLTHLFITSPSLILDLCAAPGGKTTAVASAMPEGSMLVANEYIPQRAAVLRENVIKWGDPRVAVTNSPHQAFAALPGLFDAVIVDAPCSGEGMMRKEAEARSQWSPALVAQCAALQREILASAVTALCPGGILIYSTCTFNRSENEDNVRWLMENSGMTPQPLPDNLPGVSPGIDTDIPCLRFFPHLSHTEGLFVAVLRRGEDIPAETLRARSKAKRGKRPKAKAPSWISPSFHGDFFHREDGIFAVPAGNSTSYGLIEGVTKIIQPPLFAAETKGPDLIPPHSAVLSTAFRKEAFPSVELSEEQAIAYLRRENIILPDAPRGLVTVSFDGLRLGRVNNLGNRANNLYPKNFRILTTQK